MSNFTYGDEMLSYGNWRTYESDELQHGIRQSISKYVGGFMKVGPRMNNTSEYNHDYYMKNKAKWAIKGSKTEKTKKKGLKDKVDDFINGIRNKAIDSISDFMVDVSMAYLQKMLTKENLQSLKVEELLYDTVSPVADRVAEEAAAKAADAATKRIQESAARMATETVNQVTNNARSTVEQTANEVSKEASKAAQSTANDVANQAWEWLKKRK